MRGWQRGPDTTKSVGQNILEQVEFAAHALVSNTGRYGSVGSFREVGFPLTQPAYSRTFAPCHGPHERDVTEGSVLPPGTDDGR